MAKVTIEEIEKFNKIGVAHLKGGTRCTFWLGDAFAGQLTDGAEVEMKTEERESKREAGKMERWITEVNGQGPKKAGGYAGGGGGYKGQPKDDEAIVAQVILKEACETARHNAKESGKALAVTEISLIADGLIPIYQRAYRALKEGTK